MKKSSNSDKIEFVFLTDDNIDKYINSIPLDVEEITIWNYKMCLHPEDIESKEYLLIPSLNQFTKLKCIRFYNEKILYFPGTFPQNVERIFFVSCVVNNKWTNVCIYGKHLTAINMYQSVIKYESPGCPVLGMLQESSKKNRMSIETHRESIPPKRRTSFHRKPKKRSWFCGLYLFFKSSTHSKIFPKKEVEMIQYIPLNKSIIEEEQIPESPSLKSIQRFKKTYDLLISENIIKGLMDDV
jgi:hypothetical protein